MPFTPKYQLIIGSNCKCCQKAINSLNNKKILYSITNIDYTTPDLPFSLMVVPALVLQNKLIAYGPDIVTFFND